MLTHALRELGQAHGVRVEFKPGIDPPLYETDGGVAACLLYKD